MGEVIPDMKGVWIAVGSAEHWQLAFDQGGIWGLVESHEPQWKRLTRGDMVFCYAKSPISGLVGYGQVTKTFRQNVPLWPPEVRENKVIWPLRFEFDLIYLVPTPRWKSECVKLAEIPKYRLQSGFIEISDELAARLAERFPQALTLASQTKEQRPPYPAVAGHDEIQAMLLQIGTFQRFIAEKEYPLEKERLDVVWRKVVRSVPTYVFEVQVGGDVYHALGKLKHAHDLWNSRIFLVGDRVTIGNRVDHLLSGTFHEIQPVIQILEVDRVTRLHSLKAELRSMEEELRLT
ncbi:MAG: hypothetical protein XU14_C0022G0016 [Armatimonadetes bacterium CSP1-3]|nr:MAG: hypothetical protein XU14_C0022G0016 [Armatimonadetes bacterium CSP1-3]